MKIALLFPGQGAQKAHMLHPWLEHSNLHGMDHTELMRLADLDQVQLTHTQNAQPAIVASGILSFQSLSQALTKYLPTWRQDTLLAGHSVGEVTAAYAAGMFSAREALHFAARRGYHMAQCAGRADTGMAAVVHEKDADIKKLLKGTNLFCSNLNSQFQTVVAGACSDINTLLSAPPSNTKVVKLNVAGAFHTPFMQDAEISMREEFANTNPKDPMLTILSNENGLVQPSGAQFFSQLLAQITRQVDWISCMRTLHTLGVEHAIELAPAGVLTNLVKRDFPHIKTYRVNTPDDIENVLLKIVGA